MAGKVYEVKLYFGYQTLEDGETYHAFEATDPNMKIDEKKMERLLAEALDTTRHDDRFNYGSMLIRLPATVVNAIKADGVEEYKSKQFAPIEWTVEDVIAAAMDQGVTLTEEQAAEWWRQNERKMSEALTQEGNERLSNENFGDFLNKGE